MKVTIELDTSTEEVTVQHTVVKNWMYDVKKSNVEYSTDKKFREELFTGTYKECYEFISSIVETDKEWIRDERYNLVYPS